MYFMRCVKIYRRRTTFAPILASAMDGLSNFSKRKLGRRDATGFKKLPHPDDFLLWQIAMSVRECSGTRVNPARETSASCCFFSEPEIDHFVMAITSAEVMAGHTDF